MRRFLVLLLILGLGMVLGRMLNDAPERAEAVGPPLPPCQDINGDGLSNLTDAVYLLSWLFRGGPEPGCPVSAAHGALHRVRPARGGPRAGE